MTKKVAANDSADEPAEKSYPICKRCKKPIKNPNGDNGCGARTEGTVTVTNCVPEAALSS